MTVHNHGPEDGPGLACPERRVGGPSGRLRGKCLEAVGAEGVVQVVMVDALFESFQTWLLAWGMQATRSQFDPDDVPTYTVGFREWDS